MSNGDIANNMTYICNMASTFYAGIIMYFIIKFDDFGIQIFFQQ